VNTRYLLFGFLFLVVSVNAGMNLAVDKYIAESSCYNDNCAAYGGQKAVDGNNATLFYADQTPRDNFPNVTLDLNATYYSSKSVIRIRGTAAIVGNELYIYSSDDNVDWTNLVYANTTIPDTEYIHNASYTGLSARYWRIVINGSSDVADTGFEWYLYESTPEIVPSISTPTNITYVTNMILANASFTGNSTANCTRFLNGVIWNSTIENNSTQFYDELIGFIEGSNNYTVNCTNETNGQSGQEIIFFTFNPTFSFRAYDIIDLIQLQAFAITFSNSTNTTTYSATGEWLNVSRRGLPMGSVNLLFVLGNYNSTTYNRNINNTDTIYENYSMHPAGLNITIYDEITGGLLNASISLANSSITKNYPNETNNYFLNASNLTSGETSITGYNQSYQNRSYERTIGIPLYDITELNIALLATADATAYTVYIRNLAGNAIPNTHYIISKTIGGVTIIIADGTTDANGLFTTYLHYGDTYSFTLSATGYSTATTDITASTLNPITLILYSTTGVMTWNTSLTSIIPNYWGQPLVQGETSWRTVNASYWLYDYLEFTGACVDYYWNATVLLNQSCGPTNNATNVTVIIGATQTGLVLQKFTITANGSNFTFLSWIPILPSGSGGSPEYRTGMVALIAERLVLADPTGLFAGALAFIVLIGCLLVATYIGGASIMSTIIFLILIAIFTFILPVMPWFYFMIIAVVAFAWIYLKGG